MAFQHKIDSDIELRLVFLFEDNFCFYPAKTLDKKSRKDILVKSKAKFNSLKGKIPGEMSERGQQDWLNEQ